jgi:hypothetical protein
MPRRSRNASSNVTPGSTVNRSVLPLISREISTESLSHEPPSAVRADVVAVLGDHPPRRGVVRAGGLVTE